MAYVLNGDIPLVQAAAFKGSWSSLFHMQLCSQSLLWMESCCSDDFHWLLLLVMQRI